MIKYIDYISFLPSFLDYAKQKGLPIARSHGLFWNRETQEAWDKYVLWEECECLGLTRELTFSCQDCDGSGKKRRGK